MSGIPSMSKTRELLANRMLIYIHLDSNYIDIREFWFEFLPVNFNIEMELRQVKCCIFLN